MVTKSTKHYIFTGILSILPIAATYWIIVKLFHFFSKPGATIVEIIFGNQAPLYIPQLSGFVLTIIFMAVEFWTWSFAIISF